MKGRAIDSRVFQLSSHRSCTTYSNNTFRAAEVRASLGPATRVGLTRHARLARGARVGARRARLRRRRGLRRGRRSARPGRALRLRGRVRYERPFHGAAPPRRALSFVVYFSRTSFARSPRGCVVHVRHRPRQGHVLRRDRVRARGRHAARRQTRHPHRRRHQDPDEGNRRVSSRARRRLRRVSHRRHIPDDRRRRVRRRRRWRRRRAVRHRRRRGRDACIQRRPTVLRPKRSSTALRGRTRRAPDPRERTPIQRVQRRGRRGRCRRRARRGPARYVRR